MVEDTSLLLRTLKANKGDYVSGQEICKMMGVSRTAIWKHVNVLRKSGYIIKSSTKKGYMLIEEPDIITYDEVNPYLKTKYIGRNYIYMESVNSTNVLAKNLSQDMSDGSLIVAEEQTAGRGRLGRSWESPKGEGIWMSIFLKPDIVPQDTPLITHVAALAVVRAIEKVTGIVPQIKWPNDVVINGKKVCGILTELSAEIEAVNYVVVGIGINVNIKEFPDQLKDVATSLLLETRREGIKKVSDDRKDLVDRKLLLAEVLNNFEILYERFLNGQIVHIIEESKKFSITIGKPVKVITREGGFDAIAVDIDNKGALIVERDDGRRETVIAGEVSVRGVMGYV